MGDNVNLAVGQGDLQADPLQMAVAYAAIANGGDVVRPHVGLRVTDPQGRTIQEIDPAPRSHVDIDPSWRTTILDGLHEAAMEPGGTSYPVFGGYPVQIAGKTGTAERPGQADQSWYIALAPYRRPQVRGRRDDRAGRLRRRRGGPGGAGDPQRAAAHQRGQGPHAELDRGSVRVMEAFPRPRPRAFDQSGRR